MKPKKYSEKLRDPRWQKKRLEILNRDNFSCQRCGNSKDTLMVHHGKYEGENPWETSDKYLITLCEVCHDSFHENQKQKEREFLDSFYASGFSSVDLANFSMAFSNYTNENMPHIPEVIVSVLNHHIKDPDRLNLLIDSYFEYLNKKNGGLFDKPQSLENISMQ